MACEREILELHGPWFKHPDGRFVDWSELPESEQRRLRGAEDGRMDNEKFSKVWSHMDEQDALKHLAVLELIDRHGWNEGVAASVVLSITSVVDLAPKKRVSGMRKAEQRIAELDAAGRGAVDAWRRGPSVSFDLTEAMNRLHATVTQTEEH
jgi:hypothetical protein